MVHRWSSRYEDFRAPSTTERGRPGCLGAAIVVSRWSPGPHRRCRSARCPSHGRRRSTASRSRRRAPYPHVVPRRADRRREAAASKRFDETGHHGLQLQPLRGRKNPRGGWHFCRSDRGRLGQRTTYTYYLDNSQQRRRGNHGPATALANRAFVRQRDLICVSIPQPPTSTGRRSFGGTLTLTPG